MPGGDRSGPLGYGPRTGRAAGYCAGYDVPGYANPIGFRGGFGRGGGWGGGAWGRGGRGWRNRYWATGLTGWQRASPGYPVMGAAEPFDRPPTREEELTMLREQSKQLERDLAEMRTRMQELEGADE